MIDTARAGAAGGRMKVRAILESPFGLVHTDART